MATGVKAEIKNLERFRRALKDAERKVGDLTIPLTLIAGDFYKSERAIFQLKSPGQYEDLAESTKREKQRKVGFLYPILKRSGDLEKSVTDSKDSSAVNQIVNKNTLIIGTTVAYAPYHQFGTSKMPRRPFLFIGPESRYATSEQKGRLERWKSILKNYVVAVTEGTK